MRKLLTALLLGALAGCGNDPGNAEDEKSDASPEGAQDSVLMNSPAVIEPPADTAQYDMPVGRIDTGRSDMPVLNPVDPKVEPR